MKFHLISLSKFIRLFSIWKFLYSNVSSYHLKYIDVFFALLLIISNTFILLVHQWQRQHPEQKKNGKQQNETKVYWQKCNCIITMDSMWNLWACEQHQTLGSLNLFLYVESICVCVSALVFGSIAWMWRTRIAKWIE